MPGWLSAILEGPVFGSRVPSCQPFPQRARATPSHMRDEYRERSSIEPRTQEKHGNMTSAALQAMTRENTVRETKTRKAYHQNGERKSRIPGRNIHNCTRLPPRKPSTLKIPYLNDASSSGHLASHRRCLCGRPQLGDHHLLEGCCPGSDFYHGGFCHFDHRLIRHCYKLLAQGWIEESATIR